MKALNRYVNLIGLSALLLAGCNQSERDRSAAAQPNDGSLQTTNAQTSRQNSSSNEAAPNFAALVEQVGDAVVNIEVVQGTQQAIVSGAPGDPLTEFFRRFGGQPPGAAPRQAPARGAGSGFIVNRDGTILTNAHVVANADEVTVRLRDRREFAAKVIGADARSDVAVVKIEADNLPTVALGNVEAVRPGQWVLAIGSPFGFENSATSGIVSATSRSVGGEVDVPFIQTDVAVNPGNSGGPLFNVNGEVIGINSMILSGTGGYMGLSFAIPIDVASNIRDQLVSTGKVVRGRIGVAVQDVDAQLAQSFGLDRPRGALVSSVQPEGPAASAGIKPGDVILSVDGHDIEQSALLSSVITRIQPGTEAPINVWRNGRNETVEVNVGALDEQPEQRLATNSPSNVTEGARVGLAVRPLLPDEKRAANTEGQLVVEDAQGPALRAGIQPGDIILGVNGNPVSSPRQLKELVDKAKPNTPIAFLVQRGEGQMFVPIRVT
jgi:serine protease Do